MKQILRGLGAHLLFLAATTSCAQQQNPHKLMELQNARSSIQFDTSQTLTVTDDQGAPIANATILIGSEAGNTFPSNQLTTNAQGVANIPAEWNTALPITISAPGYVISTVPAAVPGSQVLHLSKQEPADDLEIKGTTQDFGRLVRDGKVDFGLMIPAISRSQLLAFDIATVLSPQIDVITILGNDVNIPSNIAFPDQIEDYIFPVRLNKPDYRLYVRNPGHYKVSAIHGQFALQRVVSEIRAGKSIFDVINHFNFLEEGRKELDVQQNLTGIDMSVNQTPYDGTPINVTAPNFAQGNIMVALSMVDENGLLRPNDLKRFQPGQSMALKTDSSPQHQILALMLPDSNALAYFAMDFLRPLANIDGPPKFSMDPAAKKPQDWTIMSFALTPTNGGTVTPQFLPLVNRPTLNNNVLTLQAPQLPAGLDATATYLVLSEVEITTNGKVRVEHKTRLWEVWSPGWLNQFELPKVTIARRADRTYRWEVMYMARPSNLGAPTTGQGLDLSTVTHVTRAALDF
jgi:hypothetical protein